MPRRGVRRAAIEIVAGDRLHEREARGMLGAVLAITNHRQEPFAENVLEIVKRDGEGPAVRSSHLL